MISGFSRKTNFANKKKLIYGEKRKANILENCTCQQVKTKQRTLEINNAHLDRSRCRQHLQEATKNCLIHGELTETNKALLFFSELGSNLNFRRFLLNR